MFMEFLSNLGLLLSTFGFLGTLMLGLPFLGAYLEEKIGIIPAIIIVIIVASIFIAAVSTVAL